MKRLSDIPVPDFSADGLAVDFSFERGDTLPAKASGRRPPAADELGIPRRLRLVTQEERRLQNLLTTTEALEHVIALPKIGHALHLVCPGTYTGFDLICAVQKLLARPVALTLASLSTNLTLTQRMIDMVDAGTITHVDLVLAEFFAGNSRDEFNLIRDRLQARGQRCIACRNHAKISLIQATAPEAHIVVEGSGNIRSCNAVEQCVITNSPELYRFHHAWLTQLFERTSTT